MANTDSKVTIHMVASLDGFIARKDGAREGIAHVLGERMGHTQWHV
jgi:riboflavin biosynthesis pyrimidine reductase